MTTRKENVRIPTLPTFSTEPARAAPCWTVPRALILRDMTGKRYLDGSSGAMVSNIGHSNPVVLDAMKRQMEKSTFGYRLHFENQPASSSPLPSPSECRRASTGCSLSPAARRPSKAPSRSPANMRLPKDRHRAGR